jgi:hypothetical protein
MAAIVFLVLLAGHLLGDWVAQTDWQATNKPRSWAALAAHVASYHLVMGLLLLIPILRRSPTLSGRSQHRKEPAVASVSHPARIHLGLDVYRDTISVGIDGFRHLVASGRRDG